MTANQILVALKGHYRSPEWACFCELPVGFRSGRLDFYAVHTQPGGEGFMAVAAEVKVSRADFLRELKLPEKRRTAEECASESWFVTAPGVARVDEIPECWGLMECRETDLTLHRKKASQHRRIEELPLWFVAAVARNSSDERGPSPEQRICARLDGKELAGTEVSEFIAHAFRKELAARQEHGQRSQRDEEEMRNLRAYRRTAIECLGKQAATEAGLRAAAAGLISQDIGERWEAKSIGDDLRRAARRIDELLGLQAAGPEVKP